MKSTRAFSGVLPLAAALVLTACGPDAAPSADATAMAADSAAQPETREPLTDADLLGLSRDNVSLDLPWTQNRVSRDPAPSQGPAWLESVETSDGEDFTRVLFTFSDIAFNPAYEVTFVDAGADVPCGEEGKPLSLSGDRALVVRFKPANAHGERGVRVRVRTRSLDPERFTEGGVVCDLNDNLVWAAGLNEGDEVRVLELRKPRRVVVDIR